MINDRCLSLFPLSGQAGGTETPRPGGQSWFVPPALAAPQTIALQPALGKDAPAATGTCRKTR